MAKNWLDGEYVLRSTVACVTCVLPVIFFYAWLAFDQLAHAEMWVRLVVMGVGIMDGGAMWALATHWWRFADRNCAGVLSAVFAAALFPRLLDTKPSTLAGLAVILASVVAGYILGFVGHWLVVQIQKNPGQPVTD